MSDNGSIIHLLFQFLLDKTAEPLIGLDCTYIRPVSLWGGKAGNNLLCGVMKLAEAVTPAANDVYGPSSLCMYNAIQRRAKPKHDVHHRALKLSQTRIMLTLAQIWKDRGREEREEKRLHRPPSLQKKGRQRASRKKSPISRMKRGEERERQEKFPFCLSSFTAFTPRRRPLFAAVFLEDHSQVFSPLPTTKKKLCKSHALTSSSSSSANKREPLKIKV